MPLRGETFQGTNFKWDSPPRSAKEKADLRDAQKAERNVYNRVDQRDELRCVVSGLRGNPYSTSSLERLHHHHILQRGRDLGPTKTWNICLVHRLVHDLIHANALTIEGNADKKLVIAVKAGRVEDVWPKGRSVPPHVRVIPDDLWGRWLSEHAGRTRKEIG